MSIRKIDFIDSQFKSALLQYCTVYVNAREYSTVEAQTQKLYDGWFHELEKSKDQCATLSEKTYTLRKADGTYTYNETFYLDSLAFFVLLSNFEKKLEIKCDSIQFNEKNYNQSHAFGYNFGERGNGAHSYSFCCRWEPDHPLLGVPRKMDAPSPDENSLRFFEMAKKSVETDLILESALGDQVMFHSIFLTTYSDFFKRAIQMPLPDSQSRHFKLEQSSTRTLENLREFVYTRQIAEGSRTNFDELLDLFALSHEKDIEILDKYVVDLIDQVLRSPAALNGDQLTQLIHMAFSFEKPQFYELCIQRAEKLEEEKAESLVDWSSFHLAWTELILLSKKSKATLTTLKLIKLTKKFIALASLSIPINPEAGPSRNPQLTS